VATWPSLSGSGSVSILLAEEMCAEWHQAVRSCHYAGEYAILTWRFGADCPAPPPESSLGSEDLAFIPVLQAAFHGMNLEVKELQALARNSPPPAPADPGAKRFWRIKADWSVDSDADGSPDWAEFEMAEAPSHPFHLLADAFNGDVDNNQVPDGAQLDLDTDGTIDKVDTAPADPTYSQPAKPNRRYALFPVSPVNPPPSQKMAFQINDRGTVLFENGIWSGGLWSELRNEGKLSHCKAYGINDSGEIIGTALYEYAPEQGETDAIRFTMLAYWSAADANPIPLIAGEDHAQGTQAMAARLVTPGPVISNDGRVIATSMRRITTEFGLNVPDPDPDLTIHHVWTVPGTGRSIAKGNPVPGMTSILSKDLYWGFVPENNEVKVEGVGQVGDLSSIPVSIVHTSDGSHAFFREGRRRLITAGNGRSAGRSEGASTWLKTGPPSDRTGWGYLRQFC
jgi:hypothetical protein